MSIHPECPAIEIAGETIPVKLSVNRRAKRLIIKVDPLSPAILLTVPSKRQIPDGLSFARTRSGWISRQLADAPALRPFRAGARIPVRGDSHLIVHTSERRRAVLQRSDPEPQLLVGGDPQFLPRRVEDWLRRQAREEFCLLADAYCERLGVTRGRISIRDTRSRWGSCSSTGSISLSWRLIMTPRPVYRYVVAHEVSHLKHLDHSPAFWKTVDQLIDDRHHATSWLKQHGADLYGIGPGRGEPEPAAA